MFEQTTNSAIGEISMEDFAQSEYAQEAGIVYDETSTDDDLEGVDVSVTVPVKKGRRTVFITLYLDVKYNRDYFKKRLPSHQQDRTYLVSENKVTIWPGVTWQEMANRMTLDKDEIEEHSIEIVRILQDIAKSVANRNTFQQLGRTARK